MKKEDYDLFQVSIIELFLYDILWGVNDNIVLNFGFAI